MVLKKYTLLRILMTITLDNGLDDDHYGAEGLNDDHKGAEGLNDDGRASRGLDDDHKSAEGLNDDHQLPVVLMMITRVPRVLDT